MLPMKNDSKKLLFEMMEKINPHSIEKLNERIDAVGSQPLTGDIKQVQKSYTSTQQTANARIDTPQEFEEAFSLWLSTTGFNPQTKPLPISQAQTLVKNVMEKLGYR